MGTLAVDPRRNPEETAKKIMIFKVEAARRATSTKRTIVIFLFFYLPARIFFPVTEHIFLAWYLGG